MLKACRWQTGEVESLCLIATVEGGMLLTDDAAARLTAEILRYEVHGSIGVIVRSLRRGQRTKRQVLNILRSIPTRSTLFISSRLLSSVIENVTKSPP